MSVYNKSGLQLSAIYDRTGNGIISAYDINGASVFSWSDEISVTKNYDSTSSTYYYVINIPQTRPDGSKQYPFVYCPNGNSAATMSTLQMVARDGFPFAINAGYFFNESGASKAPLPFTIEDRSIINDGTRTGNELVELIIDDDGKLRCLDQTDGITAQDALTTGAVSAVCGLIPLVVDSEDSGITSTVNVDACQRQIIGQYTNGDYCIITAEGRNYDSSLGWTQADCKRVCLALGLKYAHALDGGGSTETVVDGEQLNVIYEGTYGRAVPTYIVFNGTDTFTVPN